MSVLVVVGPPGAGKSTVGELLAQRLGVPFVDTDSSVERAAGMTVADIFVEQGEPRFRELEAAAVAEALEARDCVVALGGGAILDPATRERLAGHTVVLLDVSVDQAARRVGLNQARPLLLGNPRAQWVKLMAERRPIYEAVATHVVSTDDRTPDEVVDAVVALVVQGEAALEQRGEGPGVSASEVWGSTPQDVRITPRPDAAAGGAPFPDDAVLPAPGTDDPAAAAAREDQAP